MKGLPLVAATLLLCTVGLAGCLDTVDEFYGFDPDEHYRNPGVFPGQYAYAGQGSTVLQGGTYPEGAPEIVRLVSDLPAYPAIGGQETNDGEVLITMAIWRPLNVSGPVPVIVDAGPYYEVGTHCEPSPAHCQEVVPDTIDHPGQTTPFSLRNFLPHGYAVAQVAVRGTGTAGGCMDLMGPAEQHDLVQAIDYLANQTWSNGNIAMIGVSYDGSTPWVVAASGHPALKTIVPISGLPDMHDLMFHNGSAESRGPLIYGVAYWPYGFSDEFPHAMAPAGVGQANGRQQHQDVQNLVCPEAYEGIGMGAYSTAAGDRGAAASSFWTERDYRQRVIDNYEGSIFLVHGLQDWNVDPHAAIPYNMRLREAGFEMKEWYGQWDHANPDSRCTKAAQDWAILPCRLDYAEVLLRWFDHYLKGVDDVDLGPAVQVQDHLGLWRNVEAYPDPDAQWMDVGLDAGTLTWGAASGSAPDVRLLPSIEGPSEVIRFRSEPLEEDLHLSGLPQFHLPFTPEGPGGELAVWLLDEDPRGYMRAPFAACDGNGECTPLGTPVVGHAQMNLRYHAGGDEPVPLVPGQKVTALMELEPLEVHIPAGNRLNLWVFQYHYPDHQATLTPSPVTIHPGEAVLRLPVVDVAPETVFPVPGGNLPSELYVEEMYVPEPILPNHLPQPPSQTSTAQAARPLATVPDCALLCPEVP